MLKALAALTNVARCEDEFAPNCMAAVVFRVLALWSLTDTTCSLVSLLNIVHGSIGSIQLYNGVKFWTLWYLAVAFA
jgi:hypothetical protein